MDSSQKWHAYRSLPTAERCIKNTGADAAGRMEQLVCAEGEGYFKVALKSEPEPWYKNTKL
jgi:hypothetical protein